MTLRDRLKSMLKYYKLNQSVVSVAAGFGLIVLVGALVVAYSWWRLRQPTDQTAQPEPTMEQVVVDQLPANVSYSVTEQGELVPDGLPVTYLVQPGDSTWQIAEAFYGDGRNFIDVEVANGLEPNQLLEVGQELLIPRVPVRSQTIQLREQTAVEQAMAETPIEDIEASESASDDQKEADMATDPAETPQPTTYAVVKGDSLWKIAEQFYQTGFKWTEIYEANKATIGQNPDLIYPDQEFVLPE